MPPTTTPHHCHMSYVGDLRGQKRHWIPWNWAVISCPLYVPGAIAKFSGRSQVFLTSEPFLWPQLVFRKKRKGRKWRRDKYFSFYLLYMPWNTENNLNFLGYKEIVFNARLEILSNCNLGNLVPQESTVKELH